MSKQTEALIVSAVRTPVGRFQGGLSALTAPQLGGVAIQEAVQRAGIDPATIYEVLLGHVLGAGVGQAPARQAAIHANLPTSVGAASVNKVCGSGLKAVMLAANGLRAGEADVYVAGGMESMSNAPYLLPQARSGHRYGHVTSQDAILQDGLWCSFENWGMGSAAEFIAQKFELTREELDAFALQSHGKAAHATAVGNFQPEIVPVEIKTRKQTSVISQDESIRASYDGQGGYTLGTDLASLGKLPPAFDPNGIVTAGNAPGLNDGAAALVLMSERAVQAQGVKALARVVGYVHTAVEPRWIFSAPAKAIPQLLQKIGWTLDEVDLIELNEAFAAQALANGMELLQGGHNWDWQKVNVNGGAVALGHPIGASGARVLVTLLHALQQRGGRKGIASLCLVGGEAVALAIELV
jgi:acetyl-CoA C-acetyltransferase